jgi:Flp pilus assembly pilin Flp
MLQAYTWVQVSLGELRTLLRREDGGVAAEYALLITLIALVMAAGAVLVGNAIFNRFTDTANSLGN